MGSGAGGSLYLRVHDITGPGTISASGGGFDRDGGGGRIAVEFETGAVPPLVVIGGTSGGVGSVQVRNLTTNPGSATPALASADSAVCELLATGEVLCEGDDTLGLVSGAPIGIYSALAMGPNAACALHAGGLAHCWGDVGATGLSLETRVDLASLDVGVAAACGVRASDGLLRCWGADTAITSAAPAGAFVAVTVADVAACALNAAGTVSCFGSDVTGIVGGAPRTALAEIAAGPDFVCGLALGSGALQC